MKGSISSGDASSLVDDEACESSILNLMPPSRSKCLRALTFSGVTNGFYFSLIGGCAFLNTSSFWSTGSICRQENETFPE